MVHVQWVPPVVVMWVHVTLYCIKLLGWGALYMLEIQLLLMFAALNSTIGVGEETAELLHVQESRTMT